jgi:hypothetical protein
MNKFYYHKYLFFFVIFLLLSAGIFAQDMLTLSGIVKDGNGESLPGATVLISGTTKGISTDENGAFSFNLKPGTYSLEFTFIGYRKVTKTVSLEKDQKITVIMNDDNILMDEVQIFGTASDNTESVRMSDISLNIQQIQEIPQFMGEVDIIKTIQFLPGVSSATEGASGFYVRGGGPDQNLILLDDAVIYNSSHLFGFFSVFNSLSVNDVTLIKGGMPAKYGGRLSSVLDINQRAGNKQQYNVQGSIGTISSKFMVEGPIVKDKTSFQISGRRTYIDLLIAPFIPDSSGFAGSSYFFYDMNARFDHKINEKNSISLSGYYGKDKFVFNNDNIDFKLNIPWGNAMAGVQWLHTVNDDLFIKTSLNYSHYQFSFQGEQNQFAFELLSGIDDFNLRSDGFWNYSDKHIIRFGALAVHHTFTPTSVSASSGETDFDTGGIQKMYGIETGLYASDEWEATPLLTIYGGLRLSSYSLIGPFTRYTKNLEGITVGEKNYSKGETVAFYPRLEPRFSMRYKTGEESSVKAAYTLNYQYIQLASISPVSLPTDVWIPASDVLLPQESQQFNLGYFFNFNKHVFEASVEVYYKGMKNLIEYKEGADVSDDVNDNVDNQIVSGDGQSYGVEFFLKKVIGRFNGWIGYTLSYTDRQFPDINDGSVFPAKFDRRHDLSAILKFNLNKHWEFGAAFVYASGNSITLPESRYVIENRIVNQYGPRNDARMADYNRLDVSVTYTPDNAKQVPNPVTGELEWVDRKFKSRFNFSIYNVYNRANPYFVYFDNDVDAQNGTVTTEAKQVSLFPILPAITWNFEF